MKLPSPRDALDGVVWLPRLLAKARALQAEQLPQEYAARFCDPSGVDGQFLAYFKLDRETIVSWAKREDFDVVLRFREHLARLGTSTQEWNHQAVNLGRPGYPMAERLPLALAGTYKHLAGKGLETVFEVLEADEIDA